MPFSRNFAFIEKEYKSVVLLHLEYNLFIKKKNSHYFQNSLYAVFFISIHEYHYVFEESHHMTF